MSSDYSKHIIIIHEYGFMNGGSVKIAIQTATGLAKRGYKVTYFCACGPVDESLSAVVSDVICLNQFDLLSNPSKINAMIQGVWNKKAYRELSKLFDNFGSDNVIVNIHGFSHALSPSVFKACYDYGIRPYLTIHDYFCVCPNGGLYNYKKQEICHLKPMGLKCMMCDCDSRKFIHKVFRMIRQVPIDKYVRNSTNLRYIYISNFSFDKVKSFLKGEERYYLHNPIDDVECEMDNTKEQQYFAYIGRFSPEKGIDLFCSAIDCLNEEAIAVGDGLLRENLEEQYGKKIKFLGWKNKKEMQQIYPLIKCLIFPSKWYEVAPLTPEECLSIGIPCIVPDECSASEYIEDGINGYVFKSGDLDDLKDKISSFNIDACSKREPVRINEYLNNFERIINNTNGLSEANR